MITRQEMFEPLLKVDPSFTEAWNAFLEEWQNEASELPQYLALADLARHLVRKLETGDTHLFPAIFAVVERWHLEGDDYVREAATIGLLEDLQNGNLHETTSPDEFLPWLGPESRRWWDKVEAFWRDGTVIRDD